MADMRLLCPRSTYYPVEVFVISVLLRQTEHTSTLSCSRLKGVLPRRACACAQALDPEPGLGGRPHRCGHRPHLHLQGPHLHQQAGARSLLRSLLVAVPKLQSSCTWECLSAVSADIHGELLIGAHSIAGAAALQALADGVSIAQLPQPSYQDMHDGPKAPTSATEFRPPLVICPQLPTN